MQQTHSDCCSDAVDKHSLTVLQAVELILSRTPDLSHFEKLPIRDCLDRVVFDDVLSPMQVPGADNSAVDGYAVRAGDLPQTGNKKFRIAGTAFAGKPYTDPIGANEALRIMTGAIMPADVDTVIMQEHTSLPDDSHVEIGDDHRQHENVRFAGEDIKTGQAVIEKGQRISPASLGVLASLGIAELKVYRRPRVCFFSTGDELKSIGEMLEPGDIYDSNRYTLYGLLKQCDVELIDMGVIRDDPNAIREALLNAAACSDLVLTSGGVSVGEADYIKGVLEEIGEMNFWKIAMKPGRPLTFGQINGTLFLGLPGNPVAVMVTFYQFVLPCIKKLAGRPFQAVRQFSAITQSDIRKRSNRREFQRAIATSNENGELHAELTGKQGSGILTSMARANCFIVLPEQAASVTIGEPVIVEFFADYF
jgi:molybdopterin molybdotransferase